MNASADEIQVGTGAPIYTNDGTYDTSFAKAVANSADGDTIVVLNDITIVDRAYVVNKNITIQGVDPAVRVIRGANFNTTSDTWRGFFNPGMLEVAIHDDKPNKIAKVTLTNITFDDANNPDNATQTNNTPGWSNSSNPNWRKCVYDSVLSAYHPNATIVMGEGSKIINTGGYSAIYLTTGANCILEEGSTIGGDNVVGRALINMNNSALTFNATITNFNNQNKEIIIAATSSIDFYGNISNSKVSHAIYSNGAGAKLNLKEGSKISNNTIASNGAVYIQNTKNSTNPSELGTTIDGEISNNVCKKGNAGGIYIIESVAEITKNGNISNNTVEHNDGGAGGGIYLNSNSILTMAGGIISGNEAKGLFDVNSGSSNYGGGGISILKSSTFIMNGGTISNNKAAVGGGVFVTGRTDDGKIGPRFIFNGGTIKDNIITDTTNASYGKDIAIGTTKANASSESLVGTTGGHSILIGKNAILGDQLIGVSIRNETAPTETLGLHQAVNVSNLQSTMIFGTLNKTQSDTLQSAIIGQHTTYSGAIKNSLWVDSKTSGTSFSFVTIPYLPPLPQDIDKFEYQAVAAPLDVNSVITGTNQFITPTRVSNGLELKIDTTDAEKQGYAVVILAKQKSGPLDLGISHEGQGEFYLTSDPTKPSSVTLKPSPETPSSVTLYAKAAGGWNIKSITLTAGDGTQTQKTVVGDEVTVDYYELASGTNTIHAVFEKPAEPGGGTGNATVRDPQKTEEIRGFEPPTENNSTPVSKTCNPVPIEQKDKWMFANIALLLAAFLLTILLLLLLRKRKKE
ncbi:right-handed parallel beta-helix repeat-containing protein [Methanolapillus ohkumae]